MALGQDSEESGCQYLRENYGVRLPTDYLQEQMKAAYERYYLMLRVSVRTSCIP
jgi:hypothetical protein